MSSPVSLELSNHHNLYLKGELQLTVTVNVKDDNPSRIVPDNEVGAIQAVFTARNRIVEMELVGLA
jgi:hypothetical protein